MPQPPYIICVYPYDPAAPVNRHNLIFSRVITSDWRDLFAAHHTQTSFSMSQSEYLPTSISRYLDGVFSGTFHLPGARQQIIDNATILWPNYEPERFRLIMTVVTLDNPERSEVYCAWLIALPDDENGFQILERTNPTPGVLTADVAALMLLHKLARDAETRMRAQMLSHGSSEA
ncbi:hypothetical protein BT63DRAFT_428720 [Microthyrium microscopicum]|uniref:Uncharacterized protein n=1 Tax=Microthyrium microscopicum TaxID=703497 RepID=A0A6A6U296_9PEZI|nr:hypothetical protein BT63DRAFT_428720 [Microthyrium microscopicum]